MPMPGQLQNASIRLAGCQLVASATRRTGGIDAAAPLAVKNQLLVA